MDNTLLIAFLLLNVFIVGMLSVLGFQYLRAHRRGQQPAPQQIASQTLPPEVREQLLQAAVLDFQNMLTRTGRDLQQDQLALTSQLNQRLDKLGNKIVDDEMQRYRAKLDELRTKAETTLSGATQETQTHQNQIEAELEKRRSEVLAKLHADAEADRAKLREQLDVKLSDAMIAFLTETLGHNIDIGAQHNYLLSQLEEHKQELIAGVVDDTPQAGEAS